MNPLLRPLFLMGCLLAVGCGSSEPPSTPEAIPAPSAASTPPSESPPPAPTSPDEVGPDGPAELVVPVLASLPQDPASLAKGEAVFAAKGCGACHAFGTKVVGPDLMGVGDRRSIPWMERMIRHPEEMTKKDPVARELFKTTLVQMSNQQVSDEELPLLLAFITSKKGN